jgi:AraC family transcriptional regulator
MLLNSTPTNVASHDPLYGNMPQPCEPAVPAPLNGRSRTYERDDGYTNRQVYRLRDRSMVDATNHAVEISPPDIVRRRTVRMDGLTAEVVQATRREKIEFRFRAPLHLLVICDQGSRSDGDTYIEGLPRSTLRDGRRKLTFVPAGHEYREWQEPRGLTRVVYFYFDPAKMPTQPETGSAPVRLAPRLFFEDATLFDTALKLKSLIESPGSDSGPYLEALGSVLAHELLRLTAGVPRPKTLEQGGLAAWQRRMVAAYIEEHLAEQISLAALAQLVGLSPYHFCRTFKQSFGMPPHRYHNSRRIEHAKSLLAKPASMVTEIGLSVGFGDTSSFTSVFHKMTGLTPTAYRRGLA